MDETALQFLLQIWHTATDLKKTNRGQHKSDLSAPRSGILPLTMKQYVEEDSDFSGSLHTFASDSLSASPHLQSGYVRFFAWFPKQNPDSMFVLSNA
jgi:hypothetical protein